MGFFCGSLDYWHLINFQKEFRYKLTNKKLHSLKWIFDANWNLSDEIIILVSAFLYRWSNSSVSLTRGKKLIIRQRNLFIKEKFLVQLEDPEHLTCRPIKEIPQNRCPQFLQKSPLFQPKWKLVLNPKLNATRVSQECNHKKKPLKAKIVIYRRVITHICIFQKSPNLCTPQTLNIMLIFFI